MRSATRVVGRIVVTAPPHFTVVNVTSHIATSVMYTMIKKRFTVQTHLAGISYARLVPSPPKHAPMNACYAKSVLNLEAVFIVRNRIVSYVKNTRASVRCVARITAENVRVGPWEMLAVVASTCFVSNARKWNIVVPATRTSARITIDW